MQMRLMKRQKNNSQLNNAGFTLVEVLVAAIILAIISIPLLRAFSSSANTTGKAAIKTKATNAAENVMEDIKGLKFDAIVDKYGAESYAEVAGVAPKDDGSASTAYQMVITQQSTAYDDDLNAILGTGSGAGYTVTIRLDPSTYESINNVNMSEFNTVNSDDSAIFCLSETTDQQAYKEFADMSKSMTADFQKDEAFFEKNLKREIRVDINKKGTITDEEGNTADSYNVTVKVNYLMVEDGYVPAGKEYVNKLTRQVYNGALTQKALKSIYIMYPPRYAAAKDDGDIIIIHNPDNAEANLYVVAQDIDNHADDWKDYRDKHNGGLILQIYQDTIEDTEKGGTKQPLTLYTNVHGDTDYLKKSDSDVIPVQAFLTCAQRSKDPEGVKDDFRKNVFNKIVNRKGKFEDEVLTKDLDARDIDGKTLDASTVEDKIYDVTVTVAKTTGADEWPVSVTLTGSILNE